MDDELHVSDGVLSRFTRRADRLARFVFVALAARRWEIPNGASN
ncbi:MAG: hypothetical protein PHQ28_12005 [Mycobacterium sp.]|nr:hypothetical protein [Mycobacterium sp.]